MAASHERAAVLVYISLYGAMHLEAIGNNAFQVL